MVEAYTEQLRLSPTPHPHAARRTTEARKAGFPFDIIPPRVHSPQVRPMSSSFSPTQAELALVNGLFAHADPNKLGIITGDAAVKAFGGAKLQPTVLGEIWALADSENNGFLTRKGVAIAIRLIGHAQSGQQVKESLIDSRAYFQHTLRFSASPSTDSEQPVPLLTSKAFRPLYLLVCLVRLQCHQDHREQPNSIHRLHRKIRPNSCVFSWDAVL